MLASFVNYLVGYCEMYLIHSIGRTTSPWEGIPSICGKLTVLPMTLVKKDEPLAVRLGAGGTHPLE